MTLKIFFLIALVAVALARPSILNSTHEFEYSVKDQHSSNDFGHQQSRLRDDTQGSYFVHLPDGRFQRVTYTVLGDSGFLADVTYEGEAHYPTHPSYTTAPRYHH